MSFSASARLAFFFGLGTFVLHIATAGQYGYQRDELYFLACARHLAWGYVDQPPMIAIVAKAALFFGRSLYAIRLFPALAAALIVVSTGRLAARLGGGTIAQGFAMLAVVVAPFYLAVGNLLTMNAFEPFLWTLAAYLIVELFDRASGLENPPKLSARRAFLWIFLGAVTALGVLTKYTMGFFALSLCAAALLSARTRRCLRCGGVALAIGVALLLTAPNLWWQYIHGWPQIQLLADAATRKNVDLGAMGFVLSQILMVNPLAFPLWAGGLFFFFRSHAGSYRLFFWSYVLLCVVYIGLRAKVYYLAPIYPLLFGLVQQAFVEIRGSIMISNAQDIAKARRLLDEDSQMDLLYIRFQGTVQQAIDYIPMRSFLFLQALLVGAQIKGIGDDVRAICRALLHL